MLAWLKEKWAQFRAWVLREEADAFEGIVRDLSRMQVKLERHAEQEKLNALAANGQALEYTLKANAAWAAAQRSESVAGKLRALLEG